MHATGAFPDTSSVVGGNLESLHCLHCPSEIYLGRLPREHTEAALGLFSDLMNSTAAPAPFLWQSLPVSVFFLVCREG